MENILENKFMELVDKAIRGEVEIDYILEKIYKTAIALTEELYKEGTINLNTDMVRTLQKMFRFVVVFGNDKMLEAVIYALLNGNVA